jgi:hypothetical protein
MAKWKSKPKRKRRVTTMSETLSRLQPGHIVFHAGEEWVVTLVNDCRAQITPRHKRPTEVKQIIDGKEEVVARFNKTGAPINISPNSFIEIIGYERPIPTTTGATTTKTAKVQQPIPGHNDGASIPKRGRGRPKKSSK